MNKIPQTGQNTSRRTY